MAVIALEDVARVFDRANREKAERKKAMDAIVDLCIERAALRAAIRGLLVVVDPTDEAAEPLAAAFAALEWSSGAAED